MTAIYVCCWGINQYLKTALSSLLSCIFGYAGARVNRCMSSGKDSSLDLRYLTTVLEPCAHGRPELGFAFSEAGKPQKPTPRFGDSPSLGK